MTVKELIVELLQWPADSEVNVVKEAKAPSMTSVHRIVRVDGVAGSAIDGRDSVVVINYR